MVCLDLQMSRKTGLDPERLKSTVSLLVAISLLKVVMVTSWNGMTPGTLMLVMLTLAPHLTVGESDLQTKGVCVALPSCPNSGVESLIGIEMMLGGVWRWGLWEEIRQRDRVLINGISDFMKAEDAT